MPVCEADPWRFQYFEHIACPEDVRVPTEDGDAWQWYPEQKWIYNKLMLAESQGFECGPHGIEPPTFPVFSKPIYNMRGMGAGSRVLRSAKEYKHLQRPGHMWMTMFDGEHVSTDIAVVRGEAMWTRHAVGKPLDGSMFDYWTVLAESRPEIETYTANWLQRHFEQYTGMVNIETIGSKIIEIHLRFADQWPDLYGDGWTQSLIRLYAEHRWDFDDSNRRDGYSVVLFVAHGIQFQHPSEQAVAEILQMPSVTSVQITFHQDRPPASHSMPPGGFRLAIINCWDLELGFKAREKLALSFWSTQQLVRRGASREGKVS